MLAKGRLLGLQFETLMKDGLYEEISNHAIILAEKLRNAFEAKGYSYLVPNRTNQIFVVWPDSALGELARVVSYSYWEKYDKKNTVIRLATSWATTQKAVDQLKKIL